MESTLTIRRAGATDIDAVATAFAAGSADEVVSAWVMAEDPELAEAFRIQHAPRLIERSVQDDEVWIAEADGRIRAVSIWQHVHSARRFEIEAEEACGMSEAVPGRRSLARLATVTALLAATHPREFPHRYLQLIVTVPEFRGMGAGGAILADRLKAASQASVPVYLEASTDRSSRLYARNGFAREGVTHTLPEDGPTLIPMWFRG